MRSRQSLLMVGTQRSAWAFAFGACTGVRITSNPSERKTSSRAWLNLLSRLVDEESIWLLISELHHKIARLPRDPRSIRTRGAGDERDSTDGERDEEDVDPLQEAVSTVRKSQANALAACCRKNARYDKRSRSGAAVCRRRWRSTRISTPSTGPTARAAAPTRVCARYAAHDARIALVAALLERAVAARREVLL
jgi:hypothetical protein